MCNYLKSPHTFNPCPTGGGGGWTYTRTLGLFAIAQQRWRAVLLVYLFRQLFRATFSSNKIDSRSSQARSPGHVKWPNLQQICNRVRATVVERETWNVQNLSCHLALRYIPMYNWSFSIFFSIINLVSGHFRNLSCYWIEIDTRDRCPYCFDAATATGAPLVANRRTISYGRPPAVAHGPSVTLF